MITYNKECKTPTELRNESKLPYLMFDVDMPIDDILNEIGNAHNNISIRIERINQKAGLR